MSDRLENIIVAVLARQLTKSKISILRRGLTNPTGEIKSGMAYQILEYFVMKGLVEFPIPRIGLDCKKVLTFRGRAVLCYLSKGKDGQTITS